MRQKTWIYFVIFGIVAAAIIFVWWGQKTGYLKPSASTTQPPMAFKDVTVNYWAYNQIRAVYDKGWMSGYPDGTFRPEDGATRAMVATVYSRATGKSFDNPTPSFKDIPKTYWAYKEIEGMKQAGYMIGYSDGTFRPDQVISRAEMAKVAALSYGKPVPKPSTTPTGSKATYVDVPFTHPFWAEIQATYAWNLIQQCGQDSTGKYFCPDSQVNRANLAVIVYNGLIRTTPSASPSVVKTPAITPSIYKSPSPFSSSFPSPTSTSTR